MRREFLFLKINLQEPMSVFFYPSQSACRLCQSHGRSPEVQGFPPLPFAAIHCRQTTINNAVRKRGSGQLLLPFPLPETPPLSQSEPIVISPRVDSGRRLLVFFFYFCTFDPPYLGCSYCAFISPNNEKLQYRTPATRGLLGWQ